MNECRRITASYDRLLGQNQRTVWAMVSPLFSLFEKGGQGGFTGKALHGPKRSPEHALERWITF
jgi:hypothetical protein